MSKMCTALFLLNATVLAHGSLNNNLIGFFSNGCPKNPKIQKLLPHENCRRYYKCYHGVLVTKLCPNGLHFNAKLEICSWNVNCHDSLIRTKKDSERAAETMMDEADSEELDKDDPHNASEICKSPDSNGILVAHENCNDFHKCSYGRPVVLKCAQGLMFNTMTQKCDWSHNVDCGNRFGAVRESHFSISKTNRNAAFPYLPEEIERSKSDPSEANVICAARNSDGVVVAHEYCDRFYKCFAGVPNTMKCPINLLYNPVKEHCDWRRNVDCDGRAVIENVVKKERADTDSTENADSEEKDENSKEGDDTKLSSSVASVCATENSGGVSVAHEVCTHFYKCVEQEPVAYSCPGDLLYNSQKNYCDWPRNVDCGDRTIPNESVQSDSSQYDDTGDYHQAITICSSEGSDGILLTHTDCNLFYECHDGHPVVVDCPPHLLYNPEKESCDWPTYVSCAGRQVPAGFNFRTLDIKESP